MQNNNSRKFNTVHDFESIIKLLRYRLNWPIPDNRSKFDDLTVYWSPEDLKLNDDTQKRIIGCWQLRLYHLIFLNTKQPWGIFIVQFENSVNIDRSSTLMRNVLRGLVDRRGRSDSLPFWEHDRVLFICTTEDFSGFGFVHFEGMRHHPVFRDYPPIDDFKLKPNRSTRQRKSQLAQRM